MAYTTKGRIENYLLIDIDSSFDTQIDEWIAEVSDRINRLTNRTFEAPTPDAYSAKVYDGNGKYELIVDEFYDLESVTIDGTLIDSADYKVYPANLTNQYRILLTSNLFTTGDQNISISAKWSMSESVPVGIRRVATILVASIINENRKDTQEIKSEEIGNYKVSFATPEQRRDMQEAFDTLQTYKRIAI